MAWGWLDWVSFGAGVTAAMAGLALFGFALDEKLWQPKRIKAKRGAELHDPLDVHFLVPSRSQRTIQFAAQDDREHLLNEIVLSPKFVTLIELRLHPRTRFVTSAILFGCVHDDRDKAALEQKPRPVKLIDIYGQGQLELESEIDRAVGRKTNSRHEYQWNKEIRWNPSAVIVIGIEIETRAKGRYVFRTSLIGDETQSTTELTIRVEDESTCTLRCVNGDHERHEVAAVFRGRLLSAEEHPNLAMGGEAQ